MRLPVLVVAGLAFLAPQPAAAQDPAPKPPTDADRLLGTWKAESEDDGSGRVTSFKDLNLDMRYTFQANGVIANNGDDPKGKSGTYAIDPDAKRVTAAVGGAKFAALDQLDGDALTICYHTKENQPCPTKFKADAAAGTAVMVFQRVKEGKKQ